MTKSFEYKGFWWLPNTPDEQIPGVVKYNPSDGTSLELIGAFNTEKGEFEIILGFLENGKNITLLNSFTTLRRFGTPGFGTLRIFSNFVLLGKKHFETRKSLKFYKATISVNNIDEWVNMSKGFKIKHDRRNREIAVHYKSPEPIHLHLNDSFKLVLHPTTNGPTLKRVQKEAVINQSIKASFEINRKKIFDDFLDKIFEFQTLLMLSSQRNSYLKECILYCKGEDGKLNDKYDFYARVIPESTKEKELLPDDFLLPYFFIEHHCKSFIHSWFSSQAYLKTCYDPFFSNFSEVKQYTSDKFLNVARAIEAFHRDTVGERSVVNNRSYFFRERLSEVFDNCNRAFNGLLKIRDKGKFIKKVIEFRNDFTHSNPILSSRNKKYLETHYLTESLTIILSCALLKHHGLKTSEIRARLNDSRLYTHIRYKLK